MKVLFLSNAAADDEIRNKIEREREKTDFNREKEKEHRQKKSVYV